MKYSAKNNMFYPTIEPLSCGEYWDRIFCYIGDVIESLPCATCYKIEGKDYIKNLWAFDNDIIFELCGCQGGYYWRSIGRSGGEVSGHMSANRVRLLYKLFMR